MVPPSLSLAFSRIQAGLRHLGRFGFAGGRGSIGHRGSGLCGSLTARCAQLVGPLVRGPV